jgi:glyoxylase I family protein
MVTGIAHICLGSTDLSKTQAFYTEALGLHKQFSFLRDGQEIGFYLKISDGAYIEVFLQEQAPSLEKPAIRHFCLEVDSVEQSVERIRRAGYEASDKKLGADQSWQAWATDPDGIRIELHEYTESSAQRTGSDVTVDW